MNTAEATIKHMVSLVFERVALEDEQFSETAASEINVEELKIPSSIPPKTLRPCASDAYLMFQVVINQVSFNLDAD